MEDGARSVQMGGSVSKTFHCFLNLNDRLLSLLFSFLFSIQA